MITNKGVITVFAALASAAVASWAGPGSVISSFDISGYGGEVLTGAYRDADYVYVVYCGPYYSGVLVFTPAGSFVRDVFFEPAHVVLEDPDHSFYGSSYITIAGEIALLTYSKKGGPPVRRDHSDLREIVGYAYQPGSAFYFVEVEPPPEYTIYRYDTGGSLLNSFSPAYTGKLAAAGRYAGVPGEYLITVGGSTCAVYEPTGSLVATFNQEAGNWLYGSTVGPGYPASYGTTLWALRWAGYNDYAVFQIDLGNGNPSPVVPASLGKIKSLFR